MTKDEVIKALSCCVLRAPDDRPRCGDCPYPTGSACSNRLKADALALLKQEPKRGRWITYPESLAYEGAYSEDHIVCSECESVWSIMDNDTETFSYCPKCGTRMEEDHV